MKRIRFGFHIPAEFRDKTWRASFLSDVNRALDLITGHFDSAWIVDHLQFGGKDVLEGYTTLAYLAALHPRLHFGHAVLCQSFRNPALLAKMGATLQFMSGGRFILGIGAGWHEDEYKAYSYRFPSNGQRVEELEEALQVIKALWTEDRANFEGRHYQVREARCEPKPDPIPPIMVGAFRPKMLRLTARYADWWDVSSTGIEAYRLMSGEFNAACAEVGRDPRTVTRSWSGACVCAPRQKDAETLAASIYSAGSEENFDFVGTPEQVIAQMRLFIAEGVEYFMLDCGGFPDLTTLRLLISEVLPALNE